MLPETHLLKEPLSEGRCACGQHSGWA